MSEQMYTQAPNAGRLMPSQEKKHEKSPDFWGSVFIDKDLLIELVKNRTSELVEVKLSGWKQTSKAGNHYLSLKINTGAPQAAKTEEKDPWL